MQRYMERIPFRDFDSVEAESVKETQIHTNEIGSKQVQLEFNVRDFKPEEILIKYDR